MTEIAKSTTSRDWKQWGACGVAVLFGLTTGLFVFSNGDRVQKLRRSLFEGGIRPEPVRMEFDQGDARLVALSRFSTADHLAIEDRIALKSVIHEWLKSNAVECLNRCTEFSVDATVGLWEVESVLADESNGDPYRMIALAKELRNGALQDRIIVQAIKRIAEKDADAAVVAYDSLMLHQRRKVCTMIAESLARTASEERMQSLLQHASVDSELMTSTLLAWAKGDTSKAVKFLDHVSEAELQSKGLKRSSLLALAWREGKPAEVLESIGNAPPSSTRNYYLSDTLGKLLAEQPSRLDEYLTSYGSDIGANDILAAGAQYAAATNPQVATEWLEKISGAESRRDAARRVVRAMLAYNPKKYGKRTIDWSSSLSDPVARAAAIEELRFQGVR